MRSPRNDLPVLVSAGGMEHYGKGLKASIAEGLDLNLDHFHVDTTKDHPDGEMHGGILPDGMYEALHGREVMPIISMQDPRFLESLRLIGYVRREIMDTEIPFVLSPCAASARADKDQGKVSGDREMPYHRTDLELLSNYSNWLMCVDHHNSEQAKGRVIGVKNVRNAAWLSGVLEDSVLQGDVSKMAHLSPDQSAHLRMIQSGAQVTSVLGAPLNQIYAQKVRDDRTGKTEIEDMRMGTLKFGEELFTTSLDDLKTVEILVVSDDILSSGGTMIKSVKEAIAREWLPSLKKVVFVSTHALAASADTPAEFRKKALESLNSFANCQEMRGVSLAVVAGDTMSSPITNMAENCDFSFQVSSTTGAVAKQLGFNWRIEK